MFAYRVFHLANALRPSLVRGAHFASFNIRSDYLQRIRHLNIHQLLVMPLSLAYNDYPQALDSVVAHLSCDDQVRLRLVCKAFLRAVDNILKHHLILFPNGAKISVQGVAHRIPGLKSLDLSNPGEIPEAHVLDVRGYFPPSVDLFKLKESFPSLQVLRMTNSRGRLKSYTPYVPVPSRTVVLFTNPNGFECNPTPRAGWGGHDRSAHLPAGLEDVLPDTVSKVVVNMNGDDIPVADMWRAIHRPAPHVKEVVIVIPRYSSLDDPGALGTFNEPIVGMDVADLIVGAPHGFVGSAATAPTAPTAKFTIVGLEAVSVPNYAEHFRAVLREHLSANRFEDVDYGASGPAVIHGEGGPVFVPATGQAKAAHDAKVESILHMVDMVTKEGYVKRVGRETALLELVEKLEKNHTRQHCQPAAPAKIQGDVGVFRGWMGLFDEIFSLKA
ncbi:hypothetical protein A1Q1_03253 [Trichosporon asahii var. asahii CBS 2479]|uniref:F-box domain-containing protein n=1 Tax=Trichosporon asahii var. asahii (strain ATCC 90039 / CBS 2479 / JCM 2466 / KCTC 7840 / NBRC 103889/ NCYC 2677 / UAMH 7654) TaxID=1186058 RepID=J6EY72_TRIAS|nr:hypothetical protein A1Q1_03253 [Trichosporon asahii var. asahii CBS 2479]EJT47792.1 hypothetical protein A1Q1_03253 [Trichosporon asahii var. asahii CBS 2479]